MTIREDLLAMQDPQNAAFQAKLTPGIERNRFLGIRVPLLRTYAKELAKCPERAQECSRFLAELPHKYFDENMLHALLVSQIKDYSECLCALEHFLPFVDNWATCDQLSPRALGRDLPRLLERVRAWLASGRTYTIRFGVNMLMTWFLDDAFDPCQLEWAAAIDSQEEYVRLGVAWYVATALYKQPEATLPLIEARRLEPWTHNRAIRKAIESRRIPEETKAYLRTLSIRGRC